MPILELTPSLKTKSLLSQHAAKLGKRIDLAFDSEKRLPLIIDTKTFESRVEYVEKKIAGSVQDPLDPRDSSFIGACIAYYDIARQRFCETVATATYQGLLDHFPNAILPFLLEALDIMQADQSTLAHLLSEDCEILEKRADSLLQKAKLETLQGLLFRL